jgi:HEAT repeat protein
LNAREAADYLLGLAERSSKRVASDAMFAATLADSEIWRRLLRIARDQNVTRDVRRSAIFHLGQEAADAATAGLKEIIDSNDDLEVRDQAVFALSQRPADESVPALIALIRRDNVDPRLKKKALFWLAQKDDPRALAVFEEILNKR